MMRRPPRSTESRSSAASDVYKRQDTGYPFRAAIYDDSGKLVTDCGTNTSCATLVRPAKGTTVTYTAVAIDAPSAPATRPVNVLTQTAPVTVTNLSLIHISE